MVAPKIRVAVFFTTLHKGGTEQQALVLLENIDRKRFSVVAYALEGGPIAAELARLRIPVRIVSLHGHPATAARRVRDWILADRIDVLHSLLWHTNIISRFAVKGTRVKLINSVRWAERRLRDIADYATRGRVDWWIANSEHGARLAGLPTDRTSVIRNGLAAAVLNTPLSAWRPIPKTAIMVGQFRREKRFDTLIRAARLAPDWTFTLVGDGPDLRSLRHFAAKTGARNVRFLGKRTDVDKLLLRASVSILLSRSEGTPNVALESMALGVPFIGSDIEAHRTLLSGGAGILVRDASPKAVVDALRTVAAMRPAALAALRSRAKRRVTKDYTVTRMVQRTQQVWQQVRKA